MERAKRLRPNWDVLFEIAAVQDGHFRTDQAAEAGFSTHLLRKHIQAGRVRRVQRGIYRLVHYPLSEHEHLAIAWLWSDRSGVFSHQTALFLHGLSDILPTGLELTLPMAWQSRRLRTPEGLRLHYADIHKHDRAWFGAVPLTNALRTLNDCAEIGLRPDLLQAAAHEAIQRGLVSKSELAQVDASLQAFGGLQP